MFEKFFGREYLEYLLGVHDRIVKRAKELVEILSKGEITDEQAKKLVDVVRLKFYHILLNVMVLLSLRIN